MTCIIAAQDFVAGPTLDAFSVSRLHVYATTRALEIISEAARRLPPEMQARHAGLPWRSIMDAGNVHRHAYDRVAEGEVWRTVQGSLASLRSRRSRDPCSRRPRPAAIAQAYINLHRSAFMTRHCEARSAAAIQPRDQEWIAALRSQRR